MFSVQIEFLSMRILAKVSRMSKNFISISKEEAVSSPLEIS